MSTPRNAVTPSCAYSGPATIRALNAASCSGVSSRGRPLLGRSRSPSTPSAR
jgi:hypothetical protein